MTVQERLLYSSFAGHVELREEILRHSGETLSRAVHMHNAIGIVALLIGTLRLLALFVAVPWLEWFSTHSVAITLGLLAAWLLAVTNVWCCRQRFDDSRAQLMDYVSHLPISGR